MQNLAGAGGRVSALGPLMFVVVRYLHFFEILIRAWEFLDKAEHHAHVCTVVQWSRQSKFAVADLGSAHVVSIVTLPSAHCPLPSTHTYAYEYLPGTV